MPRRIPFTNDFGPTEMSADPPGVSVTGSIRDGTETLATTTVAYPLAFTNME